MANQIVAGRIAATQVYLSRMVSTVTIAGMRTVHCTRAVFTALGALEGISSAEVTIGRAVVEHDGRATEDRLQQAIAVAGYEVTEVRVERRTLPLR